MDSWTTESRLMLVVGSALNFILVEENSVVHGEPEEVVLVDSLPWFFRRKNDVALFPTDMRRSWAFSYSCELHFSLSLSLSLIRIGIGLGKGFLMAKLIETASFCPCNI